MFDFIGDIHGHADKLKELLHKLGYKQSNNVYSHPERKVLFVGDYIDRGPKIRETLEIVKNMVDSGNAIALLGNHEYNALCFHFENPEGGHLRKHSIKNIIQHYETIEQFHNDQRKYEEYLEWFKSLPLFYETEKFRAVHACWGNENIEYLKIKLDNGRLNDKLIFESAKKGSRLNKAIEQTLKGKELKLPGGYSFYDQDGTKRDEIRIKWWIDPSNATYRSISIETKESLPDIPIRLSDLESSEFYNDDHKLLFSGHYWLKGEPTIYNEKICCLDYSVANGGKLVAYRMHDENTLDKKYLIYV